MKITKGTKPDIPVIDETIPKKMTVIGDYIEIEIDDVTEIGKLKGKGFIES